MLGEPGLGCVCVCVGGGAGMGRVGGLVVPLWLLLLPSTKVTT